MKKSVSPFIAELAAFIFVLISCEVGLGSAVDTTPPTVSVSVPEDSFIVRDNFTMRGSIADDIGVSKVIVQLTNNSTGISYPEKNAVFDNKNGTWECNIQTVEKDEDGNLIEYKIYDGTYTATVTAYDTLDQKNVASKTFTIDNTPPLVVLKSPSTVDIATGTVFGQNLYLDGIVADDNEVDTIDVIVYDDTNNPADENAIILKTLTLKNASSLEQASVAKWSAEIPEGSITNDYQDIYGTNQDAGAKNYYFVLEAHDKARKIPADPEDKGNTAKYFYFDDDIGDSVIKIYKPSGTYHILNETYENEVSAAVENAKNNLNIYKKSQGTFRLNPRNNPTYTLSGYDCVDDYSEAEKNDPRGILFAMRGQFSLGTTLSITFERGRDNYSLLPETFGVYLVKADSHGNVITGEDAVTHTLIAPYYDYDSDGNWTRTAAGLADPDRNYSSLITSTGTTYTAAVQIPNANGYEGYFWVKVVGYDKNGMFNEEGIKIRDRGTVEMDNASVTGGDYKYGLWLIGNASAPSLNITKPLAASENVGKGKTLVVAGNAADTTGQDRTVNVKVFVGNKTSEAVYSKNILKEGTFECTLTAAQIAKAAGNSDTVNPTVSSDFQVYVVVSDSISGLSTERSFTVAYDCTAPVFESVAVTPTVTIDDVDYVNGTVTIKANVSDNGIFSTYYTLPDQSEKDKTPVEKMGSGFVVDTTKFDDGEQAVIKLYAIDTAGNQSTYDVPLNVNQVTDKPLVNFTNVNSDLKTTADIKTANRANETANIFSGSNNKVLGTVTDDDGFKSVEVTVQKLKADGTNDGSAVVYKLSCEGTTSVSLNTPLSTVKPVQYKYTVTAIDSKQEATGNNKTTIGPFLVVVDAEAPVFDNLTANNLVYSSKTDLYSKSKVQMPVSGSIADDSGFPVSLIRYEASAYDEVTGECSGDGTVIPVNNNNWTDKLTTVTAGATYYYQAMDVYGKTTVQAVTYKVDDIAPAIDTEKTTIGGKTVSTVNDGAWFNSLDISFNGRYTEAGSGIKTLTYKIKPTGKTSYTITGNLAVTDMGSYETFKDTISGFALSNGSDHNEIEFTVTDYAGNTTSFAYEIRIDDGAPVFGSEINYAYDDEAFAKLENLILTNGKRNITLNGTVTDAASGVDAMSVYLDGVLKPYSVTRSGNNWSCILSKDELFKLRDDSHNIKFKATDAAGNSVESNTISIKVDTTAPVVTPASPSEGSILNGSVNFSGKLTEANTPKSISLWYQAGGTKPVSTATMTKAGTISTADGSDVTDIYNWNFNLNVSNLLKNGATSSTLYTATEAYDEAGNKSSFVVRTYTIDLDSDRPEIKFSNIPSPGVETTYLAHTSTVTLSVTDDDGVDYIKILNQTSEPTAAQWVSASKITSSTGTYSYDLGEDGKKNLWFYVADQAGGIFYTKNAVSIKQPKIRFSNMTDSDAAQNNDSVISFVIDSSAPSINSLEIGYAGSNGTTGFTTAKENLAVIDGTSMAGGSLRRYIVLAADVTDNGSGIKSVSANLKGTDLEMTLSSGKYYTDLLDINSYSDGSYTVVFTVTNNSGIEITGTKSITIDNTAPAVNLINPSATDEVTGVVTLIGTTVEQYSEVEEIKYVIGSNEITSSSQALDEAKKNTTVCKLVEDTTKTAWKFELNGTDNKKLPSNAEELKKYSSISHVNDIYTLPVYIYTKDSLGNENIVKKTITFNPYGDRPKASITYPIGEWNSKNFVDEYSNISGSIRITGAAEDNEAIGAGKVYIQIDTDNDNDFDATDLANLKAIVAAGEADYSILEDAANIPGKTDISVLGDGAASFWGILVNGTNSWNYTINANNELQTSQTSIGNSKFKVGVRAIAMDNTGVLGNWSSSNYFMIDLNAPSFDSVAKIYTNPSDSKEVPASYEDDMYLSGTKYLQVTIRDLSGLKSVKYTYASSLEGINSSTHTAEAVLGTAKTDAEGKQVYTVNIPLSELASSLGTDAVALKVVATKNSDTETTSYEKFIVYFDNDAPVINNLTLNSVSYAVSEKKIVNSNGYFTIGGTASDDGAGFDRMSFYFMRNAGTTIKEKRLYDLMIAPNDGVTDSTKQPNYVSLSAAGITKKTFTIDSVDYDMYGASQTVTVVNSTKLTLAKTDSHIRAGGYVQIGESWHKINSVSGTTVVLDKATTATGKPSAFFPYMQSIDNTGTEKSDGEGRVSSGDDGDAMPESIIKSQTTWNYDASFFSNYIPDGPGVLVTFVYDKAGNVAAKTYDVSVQNKAPRLTKLWLSTDLNSSGTFADKPEDNLTEIIEYNVLNNVGEQTNYTNMKTKDYRGSRFIIKNQLAVIPEFTNGNGTVYMALNNNPEDNSPTVYADSSEAAEALYSSNKTKVPGIADFTLARNEDKTWAYIIPNTAVGSGSFNSATGKFDDRAMSFTFWDSTEDTISGVNSNYCFLKITDLVVNVNDVVGPNVAVDPFFWNTHEDNSLYNNSYKNGHIELGTATIDPQVSGKISIRGSAFDDHTLGSLWVKFDDFTPAAGKYAGTKDSANYYKVASYSEGVWTSHAVTEEVSGSEWNFTVTPAYLGQAGHKVNWQLDIDTSAITGGMGNNKKIYIRAIDAAGDVAGASAATVSAHSSKTTAAGEIEDGDDLYNKPDYQMDVVPYIYSISDANGKAASRSRMGRYPVRAGDKILLKGFNFGSSTSALSVSKTVGDGKTATSEEWDSEAEWIDVNTIKVTAPEYSGYLNLSIDGIAVPNNTNSNTTYNIQEGYDADDKVSYGANAASASGRNFWNDDVYVSVWNVADKSLFTGSINPHSGVIKKLDKYNSGSGAPVNVDGTVAAAGPGGGYIYKQSGGDSAVDPVRDMNDSYYAAISSDDLKLYGYVSGKDYSTTGHGDNIAFNKSEVAYVSPVDEMDYTIVNGVPYYVMQDNGLGGDSGSVWGLGLHLVREGIWYSRDYFNPYGSNTIEEAKLPYIIERQGYNVASHKRDSTTGYDSVLYQFKNPRIAGWYNENDKLLYDKQNGDKYINGVDYIYVSYYDSYAKCLKYAGFRSGHRFVSNDSKLANSDLSNWGKIDMPKDLDIVAEMTSSPNSVSNQPEQAAYNHMKDGASVVAGNETTSNNPVYTEIAGEWSDIFVDSTGSTPRPVIIYYNKTAKCLEVAYGNNSFPQATNEWTKSTEIKPAGVSSDFGRYVSAAMDTKGNLHVAAQDADNAKLYYLYLKKSGSTYSVENSVAVDSSNGAGRWTDIELTNAAGANLKTIKPVISYIDTSYLGTTNGIKVAYLDDVTLTGNLVFEAMTDPAYYTAGDQRTSVMSYVKETKTSTDHATAAVGFNSDMLALDFLRDEK